MGVGWGYVFTSECKTGHIESRSLSYLGKFVNFKRILKRSVVPLKGKNLFLAGKPPHRAYSSCFQPLCLGSASWQIGIIAIITFLRKYALTSLAEDAISTQIINIRT